MDKLQKKIQSFVSDQAEWVHRGVFTDEDIYQKELSHIFAHNWLYLCHESQIKNAGDFISTYMGETAVIVARGEDQAIHVSINSCTHRGLPVCRSDSGNAKRFICPYHAWAYDVTGELVAIPQERHMQQCPDKSKLGLVKVERVESYQGLIFASFNADIESLDDYLGAQKFYLDSYFKRFPNGVEVIGEAHKWRIKANWKLPVENQLGDVAHGPFLHNTFLSSDSQPVQEIEAHGLNMVAKAGHGAAIRYMPEDAAEFDKAWGLEGLAALTGGDTFIQYLSDIQATAEQRIGKQGANIKGLTFGVYPNFSFLWSNSTIRVSHPKGPGEVEYWSWWVVPADAPDDIKQLLRTNYNLLFGPGGMLEEEDSEAWTQQYLGSKMPNARDQRYYYGMGLGEECEHSELPGLSGNSYNELYARQFYLRWQAELLDKR